MGVVTELPIRCGITGLGRISAKHREAIAKLAGQMQLVSVCDTDADALSAFSEGGVAKFSSLEEMLAAGGLDLVSICTPSGLHPQHGMLVAKAGLHAVIEKPMATQWSEGLTLLDSWKEARGKFFMVLQNRYNDTIMALKRAIDEGRFGRIYMLTANVFWTRPQSYYDQAAWRGTWALDGGAFMNQASHYVDMMGWLGGDVAQVQASIATLARKIEAEDTGAAIFRYRSGAIGTLSVTMLTYPKNREGSITVLGEKGYVRISGTAMNVIEAWDFQDKRNEDAAILSASYDTDSVYGHGHVALYRKIAEALQTGSEPDITGSDGLRSLELLCAIYDSAASGGAVTLPLAHTMVQKRMKHA